MAAVATPPPPNIVDETVATTKATEVGHRKQATSSSMVTQHRQSPPIRMLVVLMERIFAANFLKSVRMRIAKMRATEVDHRKRSSTQFAPLAA